MSSRPNVVVVYIVVAVCLCQSHTFHYALFRSETDLTSLLILFFLFGATSLKSLRLHFKSDRDEIWQDCSSSKYAKINSSIFDFKSQLQDGSHDVTSCRKVLPPGE